MNRTSSHAVGVQVLTWTDRTPNVPLFQGVSYCQAVRRAAAGETLLVDPSSIRVCRWAPVVLGLKRPQGRFEQRLGPRLAYPVAGLLLAPLRAFPGDPHVFLVQARFSTLRTMIASTAPESLWPGYGGGLESSILPLFEQQSPPVRHRVIVSVNRLLARLARYPRWRRLTHRLFRNRAVTIAFDAVISTILADMSVCRNSTVIPLLTGKVNVSHFCTGGITWGQNRPDFVTSGWPFPSLPHLSDTGTLEPPAGSQQRREAPTNLVRKAR